MSTTSKNDSGKTGQDGDNSGSGKTAERERKTRIKEYGTPPEGWVSQTPELMPDGRPLSAEQHQSILDQMMGQCEQHESLAVEAADIRDAKDSLAQHLEEAAKDDDDAVDTERAALEAAVLRAEATREDRVIAQHQDLARNAFWEAQAVHERLKTAHIAKPGPDLVQRLRNRNRKLD